MKMSRNGIINSNSLWLINDKKFTTKGVGKWLIVSCKKRKCVIVFGKIEEINLLVDEKANEWMTLFVLNYGFRIL